MITDDEMLRIYKQFLAIRRETAEEHVKDKILRHDDYELPTTYPLSCLLFGQMASDFTRGLIGEVNRFFLDLHHADCWFRVATNYQEDDRNSLIFEFAEPMLELSVGRPYSIKSHFSFAGVHLLNQFNSHKIPNWKDELPDDRYINFRFLEDRKEQFGGGRSQLDEFLDALGQLNDKDYTGRTQNFRNRIQHQFRLHFDMGLTAYFERSQTKSGVTYAYMTISPLQLETLIPGLYEQHQKSMEAFKAYWQLLKTLCTELGAGNQPV